MALHRMPEHRTVWRDKSLHTLAYSIARTAQTVCAKSRAEVRLNWPGIGTQVALVLSKANHNPASKPNWGIARPSRVMRSECHGFRVSSR
eukprot:8725867-Pyramimonas_sp.AAC.1